jgi:hypothetical protein
MTGRYLAVVSTEPDRAISPRVREAIATDPWSSVVFDAGGLAIAATETLACLRLSGERGMILGPIHRGGMSENGDVAQELARLFAGEARPELLTQSFWGDYVAFLSDPQSRAWQVLRAPFGRLACLYTRSSASVLVGSDVAGLRSAGLPKPTVDREAPVTRLAYPDHPSSSTCLSGIAAHCAWREMTLPSETSGRRGHSRTAKVRWRMNTMPRAMCAARSFARCARVAATR